MLSAKSFDVDDDTDLSPRTQAFRLLQKSKSRSQIKRERSISRSSLLKSPLDEARQKEAEQKKDEKPLRITVHAMSQQEQQAISVAQGMTLGSPTYSFSSKHNSSDHNSSPTQTLTNSTTTTTTNVSSELNDHHSFNSVSSNQ